MPKPSQRTRSRKRRLVRLPGGRTETHYKQEKIGASSCIRCGRALSGVPRLTPSKLHTVPTSYRRVERMYGGKLCHNCLQELLKQAVRSV